MLGLHPKEELGKRGSGERFAWRSFIRLALLKVRGATVLTCLLVIRCLACPAVRVSGYLLVSGAAMIFIVNIKGRAAQHKTHLTFYFKL